MYDSIGLYVRNPSLALTVVRLWKLGFGQKSVPVDHTNHASCLMGLPVLNPIGLAAGIDRTGCLLSGTIKAGYGFTEVGSVTPKTLRWTLHYLVRARKYGVGMTIGVNIRATPGETEAAAITSYLVCLRKLLPVADYVVLNLTAFYSHECCFDNLAWLARLLLSAQNERDYYHDKVGKRIPIAIKIPLSCGLPGGQKSSLELCRQKGLDGILVVSPTDYDDNHICALLESVKVIVKDLDIVSIGGVATTDHVASRLAAGAAAVQVFGSVLKQGPFVPRYLLKDLPSS